MSDRPTQRELDRLDDLRETRQRAILHATERAITMLADAQHALRKGRTHVTEEFLERTLDDLSRAYNLPIR